MWEAECDKYNFYASDDHAGELAVGIKLDASRATSTTFSLPREWFRFKQFTSYCKLAFTDAENWFLDLDQLNVDLQWFSVWMRLLLYSRILIGLWLNLFVFLLRFICDFRCVVVLWVPVWNWRHLRQCSICYIELYLIFFTDPHRGTRRRTRGGEECAS